MKLLLPDKVSKVRKAAADAKTARVLLETASEFLHGVLASKGRRSDDDRNAFWASVVSLIPRDAAKKRMVRAVMRLLKVPKHVVKQAMVMRGELEDRAKGWRRIKSSGHRDKVDGSIIAEAWHRYILPALPCPALPACLPACTLYSALYLLAHVHARTVSCCRPRTTSTSSHTPSTAAIATERNSTTCTSGAHSTAMTRTPCRRLPYSLLPTPYSLPTVYYLLLHTL